MQKDCFSIMNFSHISKGRAHLYSGGKSAAKMILQKLF